jgi:hypothetical protein
MAKDSTVYHLPQFEVDASKAFVGLGTGDIAADVANTVVAWTG